MLGPKSVAEKSRRFEILGFEHLAGTNARPDHWCERGLLWGVSMRDIRSDLEERADMLRHRINAEDAQFATLLLQLKTEHSSRLETLKVQLRTVNKLLGFAAWHHNVRTALLVGIAGAAAAELSARKSLEARVSG
jgi:hypothetical protein